MTATKMPDGTTCYTGATCKKHGFYYSMQSQFAKIKNPVPAAARKYKPKLFHIPDDTLSSGSVRGENDTVGLSPKIQQLNEEANHLNENFPEAYRASLQHYVVSYEFLNLYLRKGEAGITEYLMTGFSNPELMFPDMEEAEKDYLEMAKERKADMDNIFSAYSRPENNVRKLYRSIRQDPSTLQHKVGETFTEKSYLSTTLDPDYATTFNRDSKTGVIIYEILTRKGVPVFNGSNNSFTAVEQEVLLNRDSKFKVVDIREETFHTSYPGGVIPHNIMFSLHGTVPKKQKVTLVQVVEID